MHQFHDLAVNAPRDNSQLPPEFLPLQGRPLDEVEFPVLPSELG
jgi:hypothetical protein